MHGLQHLWLVEPAAELAEPFPTLDIALSRLWGREPVADPATPEPEPEPE